jgi:hypothetical protein
MARLIYWSVLKLALEDREKAAIPPPTKLSGH